MGSRTSVNPSEETIRIGPLGIGFLLTGDDTNGSVSVFEVTVPAGQKLAAPAHRNDGCRTDAGGSLVNTGQAPALLQEKGLQGPRALV